MFCSIRNRRQSLDVLSEHGYVSDYRSPERLWQNRPYGGCTALHDAAAGDIEIVRELMASGAKVGVADDLGFSARDCLLGSDDLPGNTQYQTQGAMIFCVCLIPMGNKIMRLLAKAELHDKTMP